MSPPLDNSHETDPYVEIAEFVTTMKLTLVGMDSTKDAGVPEGQEPLTLYAERANAHVITPVVRF